MRTKPTTRRGDGQRRKDMIAKTVATARADTKLAAIAAVFLSGAALLFVAGYAQATVLHDAAHDTRHAMAFPCH